MMEVRVYGELRLTDDEFGRMTPREVRLRDEGFARQREHEARLVIWQIQHRSKTVLRPKHILHGYPGV